MALTKKQQQQLRQLDKKALLDIVQQVIRDDDAIAQWVIKGWLTESDMLLRQLRREYTRYTQDGYYYSYHEADIYLDTLMQTIVHPLSQIAHVQPTGVASLAADLLLDVGGLSELVYPSSDRWEDYCSTVFALWIQAISAQKERSPEDVAKGYEWFDIWELCEWQETLGHDVLRALSTQFQRAGERNNAFVVYP